MTTLRVIWDHPNHPILRSIEPVLTVGGSSVPPTSRAPGQRLYDLSGRTGSALFAMDAVREGDGLATTRPLRVRQGLSVTATRIEPAGDHEPRCSMRKVGASGENHFEIHVDTVFLDVTRAQYQADARDDLHQGRYLYAHQGRLESFRWSPPGALRLLQYTGGTPHIWAVYAPEALLRRTASGVGVLVFFAPSTNGLPNLSNLGHDLQLRRYLLPSSGQRQGPAWRNATYPVANAHPPRLGVTLQGPGDFPGQIERSGRPVLYVHPFNTSGDFGPARGSALPSLLQSLLVALHSRTYRVDGNGASIMPGEALFQATQARYVSRLAVLGFSRGVQHALNAVQALGRRVHELYCFDLYQQSPETLRQWARWTAPQERVRLVGADYLDDLRSTGVATTSAADPLLLDTSGDRTLWPASTGFYRHSRVYAHGYTVGAPFELAPVGGSSIASDASGFYLTPGFDDDHAHVSLELPNGHTVVRDLSGYAKVELGFLAAMGGGYFPELTLAREADRQPDDHRPVRGAYPVTTEAGVDAMIHRFQRIFARGYARRHQWPVWGAQSPTDDPATAKGYLQLCLEHSGF